MGKKDSKLSQVNWEKLGIYLAAMATFFTLIFYLIEIKVSIAKLEVKVDKLENNK